LDSFEKGLIKNKSYESKFSLVKTVENCIKKNKIGFFYNEYETENLGIPNYSPSDTKNSEMNDDEYVLSFYKKTLFTN
jgi:hypothetical protein